MNHSHTTKKMLFDVRNRFRTLGYSRIITDNCTIKVKTITSKSLKMGENNNKKWFGQTLLKYLLLTFVWHSISATLFLVFAQALYQDNHDCMSTTLQHKPPTENLTKNAELW